MKILIIEDEFILAADLSDMLESEGYEVANVVDTGRDALEFYRHNEVDLVLCDIHINGDWDGIETIEKLLSIKRCPIIYLTAFTDADTIQRAKKTFPAAYIPKPYHVINLRMAIEIALNNFAEKGKPTKLLREEKVAEVEPKETILQVNNAIFIKQNHQFIKFKREDILYLEADNIYTTIATAQKKYLVRQTVSSVLERLAWQELIRIHRSFAVNINHIESFNEQEIVTNGTRLPLSRTYKEDFMKRFMSH